LFIDITFGIELFILIRHYVGITFESDKNYGKKCIEATKTAQFFEQGSSVKR